MAEVETDRLAWERIRENVDPFSRSKSDQAKLKEEVAIG